MSITIQSLGGFNPAVPGAIGGTTPAAGSFTTLSASGPISADGGQIAFPATQAASADANTLDDYEEGTWTPVLTFATPGDLSVAYSVQNGTYTKISRQVVTSFKVQTSTFTHTTASGNCTITGLPFAAAATYNHNGALFWSGITKANYTNIVGRVLAAAQAITFLASGSGQTGVAITVADMPTGGTVLFDFTMPYHV